MPILVALLLVTLVVLSSPLEDLLEARRSRLRLNLLTPSLGDIEAVLQDLVRLGVLEAKTEALGSTLYSERFGAGSHLRAEDAEAFAFVRIDQGRLHWLSALPKVGVFADPYLPEPHPSPAPRAICPPPTSSST